jgi:hypothetical protein
LLPEFGNPSLKLVGKTSAYATFPPIFPPSEFIVLSGHKWQLSDFAVVERMRGSGLPFNMQPGVPSNQW